MSIVTYATDFITKDEAKQSQRISFETQRSVHSSKPLYAMPIEGNSNTFTITFSEVENILIAYCDLKIKDNPIKITNLIRNLKQTVHSTTIAGILDVLGLERAYKSEKFLERNKRIIEFCNNLKKIPKSIGIIIKKFKSENVNVQPHYVRGVLKGLAFKDSPLYKKFFNESCLLIYNNETNVFTNQVLLLQDTVLNGENMKLNADDIAFLESYANRFCPSPTLLLESIKWDDFFEDIPLFSDILPSAEVASLGKRSYLLENQDVPVQKKPKSNDQNRGLNADDIAFLESYTFLD